MKTIIFPLAIGLGIGLLVTAQFKAPRQRILNPVEPVTSLTQTRETLTKKASALKDDIKIRRDLAAQLQDDFKNRQRASQGLVDQFKDLKANAGLTEIKDRGVVITLADSPKGELTIDAIVHAADLRDVVNALALAQTRAISINDERVVATSSIDSGGNNILVNNTRIAGPFVIKAAGDQNTLGDAIEQSNGLSDLRRRQKNNGLVVNVERVKEVTVPAFTGSFNVTQARVKL